MLPPVELLRKTTSDPLRPLRRPQDQSLRARRFSINFGKPETDDKEKGLPRCATREPGKVASRRLISNRPLGSWMERFPRIVPMRVLLLALAVAVAGCSGPTRARSPYAMMARAIPKATKRTPAGKVPAVDGSSFLIKAVPVTSATLNGEALVSRWFVIPLAAAELLEFTTAVSWSQTQSKPDRLNDRRYSAVPVTLVNSAAVSCASGAD